VPKKIQHNKKPPIHRIKEPINVYVSSHTQEFKDLRGRLKSRIRNLRTKQFGKRLFMAELVEDYPGPDWKATMDELLSRCSVLVLLIGRRQSKEWVDYELDYATRNDIPILAYEYYKKSNRPVRTETRALVNRLKGRTTLHGHGDRKFKDEDGLVIAVLKDLLEQAGIMVNRYTIVKREINASYARQKEQIRRG
jgi:hypothetical protein